MFLPDYYRGKVANKNGLSIPQLIREESKWTDLKEDYEERLRPYAMGKGCKSFGAIGQ